MNLQMLLRRILPVSSALILLVTGAGSVAPPPALAQSSLSSSSVGTVITPDAAVSLTVGERDVLVSLPANFDPAVAHPLLLVFGGWGVTPEQMSADLGVRDVSDAIVAYGRGVDNAWAGAPYAKTSQAEDISYARAVVDAIASVHHVSRSRVYALGHSNGGAFALTLACRAPDLVAGVVSVAGMFYDAIDSDCVGDSVPVQIIHATNDEVAAPEGGWRHDAHFLPAEEILQRWARRNGCLPGAFPLSSTTNVTHTVQLGCHTETEYVLSASAGHSWPSYAPFEAWTFLSRQFR